jgi:transcriptional regulator with XRE-family HTH domain
MSQKQVARLIGHSKTAMLSRYEHGERVPPLRAAFKLMLLYRLPLQELFKEEFEVAREELAERAKTQSTTQQMLF